MPLYAYADESIFTLNKSNNELALGSGILVTSNAVEKEWIAEAINNLRIDPDFDDIKDKRTVNRNFFHASDDSKNGHSHLCRFINKYVAGIFDYSYVDSIKQENLLERNFSEKVFTRCMNNSTLELFLSSEEVFLTIEKRSKLSEDIIERWLTELYKMYEKATHNTTSYKTFYPRINILLKSKEEPGLQVVDFLIWAVNRTRSESPDNTWHDRLKYQTWHSYRDVGNQNRAKYYLNVFPNDLNSFEEYPFKFEKPEEWESFIQAYIIIERLLFSIEKSDFDSNSMHLFPDFESISLKLRNTEYFLDNADIERIGSIFIRMFDTLPLYKFISLDDKEAWTVLFHAKYLASMLVRNDQIHFNRTSGEILRWRYRMQSQDKEHFWKLVRG